MKGKYFLTSTDSYEMEKMKEKLFVEGNDLLLTRYMVYIESLIKIKEDVELKARPLSMDSSSKLVYAFYHKQLPEIIIKGSEIIYIDGIMPGIIDLIGDLRKENYRSVLFIKEKHLTRNSLFPGHVYEQENDYGQVYKRESGVAEEIFYDYLNSKYSEDICAETSSLNKEYTIDEKFFEVPF